MYNVASSGSWLHAPSASSSAVRVTPITFLPCLTDVARSLIKIGDVVDKRSGGGTYHVKDYLRAHDGRWDRDLAALILPAKQHDDIVRLLQHDAPRLLQHDAPSAGFPETRHTQAPAAMTGAAAPMPRPFGAHCGWRVPIITIKPPPLPTVAPGARDACNVPLPAFSA
jgi:hypothetical protein